jgi:hypothetical protein
MGPMTSRKNGHGNHKQEGISYDWVLPKLVGTQNVCEYPRPRMKQGTCQTVSARHVCRGTQDENSMFGVDEILKQIYMLKTMAFHEIQGVLVVLPNTFKQIQRVITTRSWPLALWVLECG